MKNRRAIAFFLACSAVFALALALAWTYRHPVASVARATLSDLNVEEITSVPMPKNLRTLKERPVRHRDAIGPDDMLQYVLDKAVQKEW